MRQFKAIGIGEILLDMLPSGKKLGGAPANFAYHVNGLGGVGIPISRVGNDELGQKALSLLAENRVSTEYISKDPDHPTGTVEVSVDSSGVATYTFPDDVAWDFLAPASKAMDLARSVDAICFGTLAQRNSVSREAITALLSEADQALKIYDINLRQHFYSKDTIEASLDMADVLKINDEELAVVIDMLSLPVDQREALETLISHYDLELAVLTRGAEGSLLISPEEVSDLPGQPTEIVDTIGAGDSFTAAMVIAFLAGKPLDEVNRYATTVAAYVCTHPGAMPVMPKELLMK